MWTDHHLMWKMFHQIAAVRVQITSQRQPLPIISAQIKKRTHKNSGMWYGAVEKSFELLWNNYGKDNKRLDNPSSLWIL